MLRRLEMLGVLGFVDIGVLVFWFGDVGIFGSIRAVSDLTVHYGFQEWTTFPTL